MNFFQFFFNSNASANFSQNENVGWPLPIENFPFNEIIFESIKFKSFYSSLLIKILIFSILMFFSLSFEALNAAFSRLSRPAPLIPGFFRAAKLPKLPVTPVELIFSSLFLSVSLLMCSPIGFRIIITCTSLTILTILDMAGTHRKKEECSPEKKQIKCSPTINLKEENNQTIK